MLYDIQGEILVISATGKYSSDILLHSFEAGFTARGIESTLFCLTRSHLNDDYNENLLVFALFTYFRIANLPFELVKKRIVGDTSFQLDYDY